LQAKIRLLVIIILKTLTPCQAIFNYKMILSAYINLFLIYALSR
jgi:hypothetical protein